MRTPDTDTEAAAETDPGAEDLRDEAVGDDLDGETEAEGSRLGGLARSAWNMAWIGPRFALHVAQSGAEHAERRALRALRRRLNEVAAEDIPRPSRRDEDDGVARAGRAPASEHVRRLLQAATAQTSAQAEQQLWLRTARELVPDEARLLSYLSSGKSSALLHVGSGPLVGPATRRWLENLSMVAHEARLTLRDRTPEYLGRLRALGLVESGEEDKALTATYQKLEVETVVREVVREIEAEGQRPRYYRRTIRLSPLGRRFCEACLPQDQD